MSPSHIVKSAYAQACRAGYRESAKSFARGISSGALETLSLDLVKACNAWLRKSGRRAQARKCRRGFDVVHAQQQARSVEHCIGRGTPMMSREQGARS